MLDQNRHNADIVNKSMEMMHNVTGDHGYDNQSEYSDGLSQADTNKDDIYNDKATGSNDKDRQEVRKATKRTYVIALLVVLGGIAASLCFLYVGISSTRQQEQQRFERHAQDLSREIVSSFRDYETAAAWIHESCRHWKDNGDFTRHDFRVLYNYLIDGGLDFFLAEWVPNITHVERDALEEETANYYANDTNVHYNGFLGLGPNPENPEEFGLFPRSEQPYYFPIQYLEPYERIGEAVHLDLYSIVYEREAIDLAVETFQPVLTERFVIVSQETDGYSVSLIHPGVQLPTDIYEPAKDLSLLLIHIRSLLARAARYQGVSLQVYLFDATKSNLNRTHPQEYLGGAKIEVFNENNDDVMEITYYNETELEDIRKSASESSTFFEKLGNPLLYEQSMEAGARDWTIVVLPVDHASYHPNNIFALLCGVMIFGASLLLAWIWIIHNHKRSTQVEKIINKAAAESAIVSSLFPAAVRDRLISQQQNGGNHDQQISSTSSEHEDDIEKHLMSHDNDGKRGGFVSKRSTASSDDGGSSGDGGANDGTMPIAVLYHETTIL